MIIKLQNLTKIFEDKIAVDNLSLEIERGEIFGLLGVNGAGKTTTIRMLTLQTKPSRGNFFYFEDSKPIETRQKILETIGVVPQHLNFDQDLTVRENLELHARLHHVENYRARIDELLKYVELEKVQNSSVKKLSGGMKRRLLIIRALIHKPQILFLDEPTVALDPQVRRKIWSLVKDLEATIILTTHYIEEAEALCNRVAIIDEGRLIELDSPQNLRKKFEQKNLEEVFLKLTSKS